MLGDRLVVGLRTLTPSAQVRILVPQPLKIKGLRRMRGPFFVAKRQRLAHIPLLNQGMSVEPPGLEDY